MGKNDEATLKEAQRILDSFSKSLENIDVQEKSIKNDELGYRNEKDASEADEDFRDRMFKNAPKTSGDFIIAEKKKW